MLFTLAVLALATALLLLATQIEVILTRRAKDKWTRDDYWLVIFMLTGLLSMVAVAGHTMFRLIG
jgi:hypothetical protein